MIEINALSVNGKSTEDFPFLVYVERNDGFRFPKKKNQLIETEYTTGAAKNTVEAWPAIPKEYTLFCPTATLKDMRQVKSWAVDYGQLIADDEPDVFYEILDVDMSHSLIDSITGYRIEITFVVQPFAFELEQTLKTYHNNNVIVNHTNAAMYPRIDVYGTSGTEVQLQIGQQVIKLRELNQKVTIESKPLEQNVYDKDGRELNSIMNGDFIEIQKETTNDIKLTNGIDRIEILERWAWL